MRSLQTLLALFLLCNIAVGGTAAFNVNVAPVAICLADTVDSVASSADTLRSDSTIAVADTLRSDSTIAVADTLRSDSTIVVADTLRNDSAIAVVDSLTADSLAMVSAARKIIESIEYKPVYRYFKEKPEPGDAKVLKMYTSHYKRNISRYSLEEYESAFLPWSEVFNTCERRTLDMYFDGIGILLNMVKKDTLERKYDKLAERREQMMEIYNLAVDNIADLNAQIDTKRTGDTLTVAKLRVAQCNKFFDLWALDSIYNSGKDSIYNGKTFVPNNIKAINYWQVLLTGSDSTELERMYNWHKDIVFSDDNNISDYRRFYFFSGYLTRHAARINNALNADTTKNYSSYIMGHLKPEWDSISAYTKKRYELYTAAKTQQYDTDLPTKKAQLNNGGLTKDEVDKLKSAIKKIEDDKTNFPLYAVKISDNLFLLENIRPHRGGRVNSDAIEIKFWERCKNEFAGKFTSVLIEQIFAQPELKGTEIYCEAQKISSADYLEFETALEIADNSLKLARRYSKGDKTPNSLIVYENKTPEMRWKEICSDAIKNYKYIVHPQNKAELEFYLMEKKEKDPGFDDKKFMIDLYLNFYSSYHLYNPQANTGYKLYALTEITKICPQYYKAYYEIAKFFNDGYRIPGLKCENKANEKNTKVQDEILSFSKCFSYDYYVKAKNAYNEVAKAPDDYPLVKLDERYIDEINKKINGLPKAFPDYSNLFNAGEVTLANRIKKSLSVPFAAKELGAKLTITSTIRQAVKE